MNRNPLKWLPKTGKTSVLAALPVLQLSLGCVKSDGGTDSANLRLETPFGSAAVSLQSLAKREREKGEASDGTSSRQGRRAASASASDMHKN